MWQYDNIFTDSRGFLYGFDPEGRGGMLIYKFAPGIIQGIEGMRVGFMVHTSKYMQQSDYGEVGRLPENSDRPQRQLLPEIIEPEDSDAQVVGFEIYLDEELKPAIERRYNIKPTAFGQQEYIDIVLKANCRSIEVKFVILNNNPRFMEWNYLALIPSKSS